MTEPAKLNADTQRHINLVRVLLRGIAIELLARGDSHDQSKFYPEEADVFDEFTPRLKGMKYGSQEYRDCLAAMKPALDHHYAANRHHPEHFRNGVNGMNLVDLVEMFIDWVAAGKRHADGNIHRSIDTNRDRFGLTEQLAAILHNTAMCYGEELGIANQFHGRCQTCQYSRFQSGGACQCSLTSATQLDYDSCERWKSESEVE